MTLPVQIGALVAQARDALDIDKDVFLCADGCGWVRVAALGWCGAGDSLLKVTLKARVPDSAHLFIPAVALQAVRVEA